MSLHSHTRKTLCMIITLMFSGWSVLMLVSYLLSDRKGSFIKDIISVQRSLILISSKEERLIITESNVVFPDGFDTFGETYSKRTTV